MRKNRFIMIELPKENTQMWFIRIGSLLLQGSAEAPIFSERMGFRNYIKIPFSKWRVRIAWEPIGGWRKMKEITNSNNTGGVIIPDEFHDQLQEWLNEAEENRKKWNQAIAEGNAYIIDEDGNKIKV